MLPAGESQWTYEMVQKMIGCLRIDCSSTMRGQWNQYVEDYEAGVIPADVKALRGTAYWRNPFIPPRLAVSRHSQLWQLVGSDSCFKCLD